MTIKTMTVAQATTHILEVYGLDLGLMLSFGASGTVKNGKHEVMLCDYRDLDGYNFNWTIGVYRGAHGHLVERINIPR